MMNETKIGCRLAPWGWGFSAEPLASLSPTGSAAAASSRGRWSWPRRAPARWRQTSCLSFKRDVCEETRVDQAALSSPSGRGASPISRVLLLSEEVERKVSSLQERVTEPTSSELVAKMRALSSDRLTPAMEATSLMSSSLDEVEKDNEVN